MLAALVGCAGDGRDGADAAADVDGSGDAPGDVSDAAVDPDGSELGDATEDGDTAEEADGSGGDVVPLPDPVVVARPESATLGFGAAVDVQLTATGGEPPYTWSLARGDAAHGRHDGVVLGALPEGLSLGADGRITGTTAAAESFAYFVVQATDSLGATGTRLVGVRVAEDPEAFGPLRSRAEAYQARFEERHLVNDFAYDIRHPGYPNPCESFDGTCFHALGDTTFIAGQCTMAMAFRAGVEPTEEHVQTVRTLIDGWRFFERLVGVGGIVGRSFVHIDDLVDSPTLNPDHLWPETEHHRGEGELSDWLWVGDTSRDQMTGAVLGIAAAHAFVDDEHVRTESAAFLTALGHHILDNDLNLVDSDGEVTTYGDLDGRSIDGFPLPNGLNAVCSLAWLKIAHAVSGEERFAEAYTHYLLDEGYVDILRDNMWVYAGYSTKHYNTYMAFENFYHLMRLEQDPELRGRLRDIFRDTLWLNTDDNTPNRRGIREHNPVKTAWYLFSTGERDEEALFHALWQLVHFPEPPLRDHAIDNTGLSDLVVNPNQTGESLYALRSDQLPPDMVRWHRSTFALRGGVEDGTERTGCDYLLPYWMGRYYGTIDADW